MAGIHFFQDEVSFNLPAKNKIKGWLKSMALTEGKKVVSLNFIFTTDEKLLNINHRFLKHDYYTDIITFQDIPGKVSGEIYISIDRVEDNANKVKTGFIDELHRVLAHGVLHLLGYEDGSKEEKRIMRAKEDFYLTLRDF